MSDVPASPTGLTVTDHGASGDQTFSLTSRLVLAANTTLQLTFLFAYLYLRANNFNGMWHPSGVSAPPEVLALIALLVPVVALIAFWAASMALSRGTAASSVNGLLWLALAFIVLTAAVRIFLMYQFGWDVTNGTYIDISTVWYGVILSEFIIVGLWTISLVMGHVRGTTLISAVQARAVVEQWSYITVAAFAVYALVEFVT